MSSDVFQISMLNKKVEEKGLTSLGMTSGKFLWTEVGSSFAAEALKFAAAVATAAIGAEESLWAAAESNIC